MFVHQEQLASQKRKMQIIYVMRPDVSIRKGRVEGMMWWKQNWTENKVIWTILFTTGTKTTSE